MTQPIAFARRSGRPLLAALAAALLACCSGTDEIIPLPQDGAVALQVVSRNPQPGVAGQRLPELVRVRAVDASGAGVEGINVTFRVTEGGGSFTSGSEHTDAEGYVQVYWALGPLGTQAAAAQAHGLDLAPLGARIVQVPATAAPMLGDLADYIPSSMNRMVDILPTNPRAAPFMEAKIAMLQTPGLGGDIVDGRRWAEGSVASRSGAVLPVAAIFPLESMRGEVGQTIRTAEAAIPVLEDFLGTRFPTPSIRIWYGFVVGSSGGGGTVNAEDRTTYQARTQGTLLPYDPMIVHELSHSWMLHEGMNQLLELYAHNVLETGSRDAGAWTWTRGWEPGRAANEGVHALLDIYALVGPEAMGAAYRAVLTHRPPYGVPLSQAAKDAFAAAVPEAVRVQVIAKLAKVVY